MNYFTKYKLSVAIVFLLGLLGMQSNAQTLQQYENGVLKGAIKVKLRPEVVVSPQGLKSFSVDGIAKVGVTAIDKLNVEHKVNKMERVFPYSPKFETRHQKHGLHLWYRIEIEDDQDIKELVKSYSHVSDIDVAEPYYEKQLVPYSITHMDEATAAAMKSTQTLPFNDPILIDQWHYNNTGDGDVTEGADINLYKAWETQAGQSNVIVSVHDEGIQYDHEDLLANMWVNEAELYGTEGVDDDGNGYVDDVYGFNFTSGTGDFVAADHGTHVAGTVAAVNNNGIGVAGVAGGTGAGDGVRIMGCQIIGGDQYPDIAGSFVYAADMGAVISQNSWGWQTDGDYEQSVLDAIDYFIEEAGNYPGSPMKGGVAIFAAGNNGSSGLHYPAAYEPTVAVGATGPTNLMTDYSNYGTYIDITAPGGENAFGTEFGVLSTINYDGYAYLDGTSMACPHVSGVAALIVSEHGGDDFTVDDLKVHLLGGTNVLDTLPGNAERFGMMGLGGTDAELALRLNNGIPPNVIDDLELKGISQDFASLKWTVPVDEDDDKASFFEIYYSTVDFDESNIDLAAKVLVKNNNQAGHEFSYELGGLEATSEYYFSVKGLDRWGNASALSNKVVGTTNEGPEVAYSVPEITFNIDVTQGADATTNFDLLNVGEGVLKWEVSERHIKNTDTYSVEAFNYPLVNSASKLPELRSAPIDTYASSIVPYAQKPVENDDLYYFHPDYLSASMVTVGDVDLQYTNSMATRFELTREQGFNMTHFEFALNLPNYPDTPLDGPVILELYEGIEMESAKRIYAQEYVPEAETIWHFVEMTEQVFFESGDVFFMVIHVPANNRYPLMASWGYYSDFTDFQFYSNNMGQTWDNLGEVFSPDYVWDVAAWSRYEPLETYLKLSPREGVVQANSGQDIQVDLDASKLINGDYQATLSFLTNETGKEINHLPVNFTVTGNKPILESENVLEFGNVFVGESTATSIEISNSGLGAFAGNSTIDVQISNPDFQLTHNEPSIIYAQRSQTLSFRYWPKVAGASNSLVTLTDKDGNQYKFNLFGVGTNPPVATVEPAENTFSDLNLGDVVNGSFTLRNDGEYPLKYYVPKFADGSNLNGNNTGLVHLFGYAAGQVEGDETTNAFDWVDISSTGIEVGQQFASNAKTTYIDVPIGFDFPFFEEKEDTVYITKQGALSFTTDGWFNSQPVMYGNSTQASKLICAYGLEMDLSKGGAIYYQKYPDRIVVQYDKIPAEYLNEEYALQYTNVTFQIILLISGDIEINYKDLGTIPYGKSALGYRTSMQVSIFDEGLNDGILLNGFISPDIDNGGAFESRLISDMPPTTGYMMYFRYPGLGSVQSVTNPFGTLQVGESVQLDYVVDTKDLFVDDFVERINVISNDPVTNPAVHSINLNIVSGGDVDYQYNVETIEFGNVFQRDVVIKTFAISNVGKAIGTIESISFQNGNYTAEGYLPVELKPNSRVEYIITINSDEIGNKDDVLIFTDKLGNTYQIPVHGNVVEAPIISTSINELSETLNFGSSKSSVLSIDNTGKNPMKISPVGNEWLSIVEQGYAGQTENVDYHVTFEEIAGSSYDNWIDIRETGKRLDPGDMYETDKFWRVEKLPFEFPFYGNLQDSVYIGFNGIIMFEKTDEALTFGPQDLIPSEDAPDNFIAPLWGPIGPAWLEIYPTTGTYYQEFDDKVVIQFQEYENLFGMGHPVSFELVLYANGNIKFMYYFPWEEATTQWCVAGIENPDGTIGHAPSQFVANLIKDGSVITFVPVEEYEIDANSSKSFELTYDARSVYGGAYQEDLLLTNNTPDAPDYALPVTMTVIGNKKIELRDSLKLGEVFIYDEVNEEDNSTSARVYDMNFTLANIGTEKIFITRMRLQERASGLTVMGDQDKYGTSGAEDPWVDLSRKNLNTYLKPENSETFNLRVKATMPESIVDTVVVYCDLEGGLYKIPVSASYTNPPVVNIQSEGLEIFTNSEDEIINESVVLDNIKGEADLTYEIDFDFVRATEPKPNSTTSAVINNASDNIVPEIASITIESNHLKSTEVEGLDTDEYNRILEYETVDEPTGMIGFGGGARFYAATAYDAPASGFNLTHAMAWIGWGETLQADIEVLIYGGAEKLLDATLLYSQTYEINESEANTEGEFRIFELDQNLLFYPNEKFFVMFKFDKDLAYPLGHFDVEEPIVDRYYFGNDETIFELVDAGYEDMGWIMKAAEKDYKSNIWAILDSEKTGTIVPGESNQLDMTFIAEYAEQGINIANMLVKSNDPVTPIDTLIITLNRNKGPQFTDGDNIYYAINEADVLVHNVVAIDEEGDSFTLELKEEYEYVTASSNDNALEVTFAPDYDGAGVHQIVVVGTDSYGNENSFIIDVAVSDVNRAPIESPEIGNQYYILETEESYNIDLSEYIIDPDGDMVLFQMERQGSDIVDIYTGGTSTISMQTKALGSGSMKITAFDEYGEKLETSFNVFVDHRTAVDSEDYKSFLVYPNPTNGLLNIEMEDVDNANVKVRISNASGILVKAFEQELLGEQMTVNLESLAQGIYFLEVQNGEELKVQKITKK
ncbi:S8 family serine peptidase [Carboxylicivirga sp. N1Y90]|uniref:S8 family serine peptidase n=1 Tax=Carboxylicivirga fragile TaxID=3417571 RepID=UPI003D3537BE|nr:S8 family serine peptidase [Marinilabiliaceae bacterium N1Y90]